MLNSQKPRPLQRKQLNTQNSLTPVKKTPITTQSLSMSNHKNQNLSFDNSYTGSGSGVSYSELQIILENVQQVKKKATQQMASLQKKCTKMQQELKSCRQQLQRYQNLEQTIKMEKQTIQNKYQVELRVMKQELDRKDDTINLLSDKISQLTHQLNSSGSEYVKLKQDVKEKNQIIQTLQKKYLSLTQSLKITQQSPELHFLKQNFKDLPSLLSTATSMKSILQQQNFSIEQLKQVNEQMKIQIQQNSVIMTNITQENKHLLNVVGSLTQQKQRLIDQLKQIEGEKMQALKQKDCTLNQIQDEIGRIRKDSQQQVHERQEIIGQLRKRVKILECQIQEYESKQLISRQENQFKAIVDEVCDEYADYEKVLKRIEYLQKYRSEYYFNVQKIQYLCKILDS